MIQNYIKQNLFLIDNLDLLQKHWIAYLKDRLLKGLIQMKITPSFTPSVFKTPDRKNKNGTGVAWRQLRFVHKWNREGVGRTA